MQLLVMPLFYLVTNTSLLNSFHSAFNLGAKGLKPLSFHLGGPGVLNGVSCEAKRISQGILHHLENAVEV